MFLRRRPLLGAAVVGGTAYYAGKKRAQSRQAEADQDYQIQQLQAQNAQMQQQAAQSAPAAPAPAAGGITDQLGQLKSLLDAGVLTQEQFETAKAKVLAGG